MVCVFCGVFLIVVFWGGLFVCLFGLGFVFIYFCVLFVLKTLYTLQFEFILRHITRTVCCIFHGLSKALNYGIRASSSLVESPCRFTLEFVIAFYPDPSHKRLYVYIVHLILCPPLLLPAVGLPVGGTDELSPLIFSPQFLLFQSPS